MENVVARIRKLLALAKNKGASEAEAGTAMKMASDLMMKYNIENVPEEGDEGPRIIRGQFMHGLGDKWQGFAVAAVGHLFDCQAIVWGSQSYKYVGRPFNVAACEETLPFVLEQIQALYKQGLGAFKGQMGRLSKSERGEFRATFKEACALRVWQRAREIKAAQKNEIPSHKALVVVENIQREIAANLADLAEGKEITARKWGFGTGAGFSAGENVQLQRRVNK